MNPLYQETIGKATIQIVEYGNDWIVSMDDDGKHYERTFKASPYPERDPYSLAIAMYDNTITALQKKYNTGPSAIGKPDFIQAVTEQPATEQTKVLFRTMDNGEIVAVMPEEPGADLTLCLSYMHVGQHGDACPTIGERNATRKEYAPLLQELESIGYSVKVIHKIPSRAFYARAYKVETRNS